MKYISVTEASKRWGITDRRVRILCNEGRIDGAIRLGWSWTIPDDTPKPRDGRVLRRFKNMDIRPGSVDVAALDNLKETYRIADDLKSDEGYRRLIKSSVSALLEYSDIKIGDDAIDALYSGNVVEGLSLKDHFLLSNFRSIMLSLIGLKEKWCEKDIKEIYVRLMQGIDDISSSKYRDGEIRYPLRDNEEVKVDVQMETLFSQYESSWKDLNGLVSGVLLFGELLRIEPFEEYSTIFSYLILSGELLRKGYLPPYLTRDSINELKAAFSLALKRGNYQDFTSYIERAVIRSYKELFHV